MRQSEKDRFHSEMARRMAEPEYLKRLRKQAEMIEWQRQRDLDEYVQRSEADQLRETIRRAGHTPVCSTHPPTGRMTYWAR